MRRSAWRRRLFCEGACAALLALTAGVSPNVQAEPLRVCTVVWPPHVVIAADRVTVAGTHTDLVTRAMRQAGFELSIDAVTWEHCLHDLSDGYYAAAYAASYREERSFYAVYPREPLDTVRYIIVVRRGEGRGWNALHKFSELPQPVAAPRGWAVTDELRLQPGLVVDDSSTQNDQDIRKLLAGRVGSVVVEKHTADALLAAFDRDRRLEILKEPLQGERRYFMIFSRKALGETGATQVAERFSQAMMTLRSGKGMP